MSDSSDVLLLELRDVGIEHLPEAGDAGDSRVRKALERESAGESSRRPAWTRKRIKIGGLAMPPLALLAVVATAAAATTTAVVTLSATTVFQQDPQGLNFNGDIETVLPSTVRQLGAVSIPDYGQVAVWGATTKPGGFCFATRLPDGDWGGLNTSQDARDGWGGGSIPGCFQTQQQQILKQTPLRAGQQPSPATGQELIPTPLESWSIQVKNSSDTEYSIYVGYVEADGRAVTVRDTYSGATAQVTPDGYYVLAEPTLRCAQIPQMASNIGKGGLTTSSLCAGGDNLQVLDAAGHPLSPDYSWGEMLPNYTAGPSQS